MYVCMYACGYVFCVCKSICTCVCVYVCMYVYMYLHMHVCMCACTYVSTYVFMYDTSNKAIITLRYSLENKTVSSSNEAQRNRQKALVTQSWFYPGTSARKYTADKPPAFRHRTHTVLAYSLSPYSLTFSKCNSVQYWASLWQSSSGHVLVFSCPSAKRWVNL